MKVLWPKGIKWSKDTIVSKPCTDILILKIDSKQKREEIYKSLPGPLPKEDTTKES